MKILFMGSPEFAVTSLRALLLAGHTVVGVVSVPDKPKGRGNKLQPTAVKAAAQTLGIPVYTPPTLKNEALLPVLRDLQPDLIAVVAYGKILPPYVLDFPPYGCVNVHGSLLPAYRGAAPMQRAVINGDTVTGITTMFMDEGMDTGDMLLRKECPIEINDNFETVHNKLAAIGAELLCRTVEGIGNGSIRRIPQPTEGISYADKITKEETHIDFSLDALTVHNRIRGMSPFPLSYAILPDGKLLKFTESRLPDTDEADKTIDANAVPGTVLSLSGGAVTVACGKGAIRITGVLPEGKSRMSASDFINGRKILEGDVLR